MITMCMNLLVVNPNSTLSMTDKLTQILPITRADVKYHYFTNPTGPPSIDDEATALLSAENCMKALVQTNMDQYDGFVVACYSLHPLVGMLKRQTKKPVVGVFEASITACLQLLEASQKFGIVSTGKIWETLLTTGVSLILGASDGGTRFAGVQTTGFSAIELHEAPLKDVQRRMKEATKRLIQTNHNDVAAICLGCVAMADMRTVVREACIEEFGETVGSQIRIVDGFTAATGIVQGLIGLSV
ncbi:Asp/Glu/hydantoin racemase [Phlebopus sp. FC_14]|nr:Asp/Glu/hydantoin racemase [Phlebopus sp. FC_14]